MSVFVDESGDFGPYDHHAPYYLVTLIFHNQSVDIADGIQRLDASVRDFNTQGHAIHTGPLIRREGDYINRKINERRQIFNRLFNFARTTDFTYKTLVVEKKQLADSMDLHAKLSKQLSQFLFEHIDDFSRQSQIIVYYDNGQVELTKILVSVFNVIFNGVEFRKILPSDYKLAQVADLICTLELLALKSESKLLSKSEIAFFETPKHLKKSYIRAIQKKRL